MKLIRENIVPFWSAKGETGIYSQWYMCPITIDNETFCCNEQYMMYRKAMLFEDYETAKKIRLSNDPREIKALGREVKNFETSIWEKHKRDIVYEASYAKFSQHEDLKEKLLSTGEKIIIEASPYDTIWGIGLFENDPKILDTDLWRGQNLLGQAIMAARSKIRAELN